MQEKVYDSKLDIWSLDCLICELCALKPPFDEANTHSELSIFIQYVRFRISLLLVVHLSDSNGRIPQGYSQALKSVIKPTLNLNVSTTQFLTNLSLPTLPLACHPPIRGSTPPI